MRGNYIIIYLFYYIYYVYAFLCDKYETHADQDTICEVAKGLIGINLLIGYQALLLETNDEYNTQINMQIRYECVYTFYVYVDIYNEKYNENESGGER